MPTNTPEPLDPKRAHEDPDPRGAERQPPDAEQDAPEVQLGEDPGTLGSEGLEEA